jgi:acyl-CoA synthetase (AMP-forming)/AMP-acid ligase II
MTSVLGALVRHARQRGGHTAIRFLARGEAVTATITYAELLADVTTLAGGLLERDLAGRPVVLALAPGIAFVTAFLACLRAGAIAVPVPFPPLGEGRRRLAAILADACPAAILVDADHGREDLPAAGIVELEILARARAHDLPPEPHANCPAVIQYSSGSTGAPRGIVLSHGNLAANARMIDDAFGSGPADVGVSWLPPHHDMGLFGAIVQPVFVGGTAVLMPPLAFVQKPLRWLQAIELHGCSISGAPNFGYELCVRRVQPEQVRTLDLSAWTLAFCGAEPIRAVREVTVPGGGALTRVNCGQPPRGCTITIRDPAGPAILPPGMTGEICVAGPHVAIGLWQGATGSVAALPETAEPATLRTGDIGVLTEDGLVVLDRLKDVIYAYGRGIHAFDVEAAALDEADGRILAAAAFGVTSQDGEALVLLCETPATDRAADDLGQLADRLAQRVGATCQIRPRIRFIAQGALPRTSSGKIQRYAARQCYLADGFRFLAQQGDADG